LVALPRRSLGGLSVAIPGTRYLPRLEENLGALTVSLTAPELAGIAAAVPGGAAAGMRYPAGGVQGVCRGGGTRLDGPLQHKPAWARSRDPRSGTGRGTRRR
jgi:hypothetical protein